MRYIVDGYNLMYVSREDQPFRKAADLLRCRESLIGKLAVFAAAEGTLVTVVFDGEEGSGWGRGRRMDGRTAGRGGVDLFFSGTRGGADAEIIRRLETWPNRKNVTVVSSDREVMSAARRLGAVTVRSGDFMKRVKAACTPSGGRPVEPYEKYHGSATDTDFWLGVFDDEQGE